MRVAIAEDSVLLREGLARLLDDAGFDVVAQCEDADELLLKVRQLLARRGDRRHPAAADPQRRGPPGGARDPRAAIPSIGVLVLSQYVELGLALTLLADSAEGVGYLLKDRIGDVDGVRRRGPAGRRGRLGARSDHRLDAALPAASGRPARAADAARARGARADGRRAAPTRASPTRS